MRWDPIQYGRYADERSRPFFDLLSRVDADAPRQVADLGCGSGELTAALATRWPTARVLGVDSSPEMIDRARPHADQHERLDFTLGAAEDFTAEGYDVLFSNALLQWVPGHRELLTRWAGQLNHAGWLAFSVPANFDSPSHVLMRELTETPRWRDQVGTVLRHAAAVADPQDYLALLTAAGLSVEVWQTRYFHVLAGDDPVLEWVRGTGLRPVLAALPEPDAAEFVEEYRQQLRQAYPRQSFGTVFPFRRTFVAGRKP